MNVQGYSAAALAAAREQAAAAQEELLRQETADKLRSRPGLSYAYLDGADKAGPMLVAYEGEPIGEVYSTSPGTFLDWYAIAYTEGARSDGDGPFRTARAAAASLLPH